MGSLFRSKNEVVYELLHTAIIQGEYKPGDRIVIDEQAARLGVSQIPIREALRQLEADGFVRNEPHVGVTVTSISATFIFEIFALLEAMEVVCSRAACLHISDDDVNTLSNLVDEMNTAVADPHRWSVLNKQFHMLVCDLAQTGLIKGMMRNVLNHWDRLRQHYLKDVLGQRLVVAQEEHRQIMDAFYRRDADEVEQLVRIHNQNALASYIEHLRVAGHLSVASGGD